MLKYELKSIKGRKKFDNLFSNAVKFYEKNAAVFVSYRSNIIDLLPESSADSEQIVSVEYALSVRKKTARKAVIRNRIKRLLRESLKIIFKDYENSGKITAINFLVIVWADAPSRPKLINLNIVLPVVRKLIERAEMYNRTDKGIN